MRYKAVKTAIKLIKRGMEKTEVTDITDLDDRAVNLVFAYYKQFGDDAINHLDFSKKELDVL